MKKDLSLSLRYLAGIIPLILCGDLYSAPLAWFPGPTVDPPFSGAAAVATTALGNIIIGGDGFAGYYYPLTYPESLTATNQYWNYQSPIYSLIIAPGAVANGGDIIVYGGTDGSNSTSATISYSPSDGTTSLAPMSVPRAYLGYAPDRNGNAYAIGGLDDNGQPLASVERFNRDSGSLGAWSAIASLPAPRYNFPAVFDHTNQIYIFGGYISGAESANVLRYSVSKNTWTNMTPMPIATAGSAAALGVDGKIYVVGGTSSGTTTNVVQVYNPTNNSWTISTPLPESLSASAMGVDSLGRLIVIGGMDADGYDTGDVWRSQPLGAPDVVPVFTLLPATNGTYLAPYVSSINATGNPPATYSLVTGPASMTVDYYSGTIDWTPQGLDQIGTIPVTIQAANYAGATNWDFSITVPNPPPALVTNLAVVSVTENSVTLSWNPEDPVAGSVTYSVYLRHVLHDPKGSGATIWYTQIGSTTSLTTLTIGGLTPGLAQTYYVVATGPGGASGYAGISATTLSVQPPTNIHVTGLTSTTVSLTWDPPSGPVPAASYEVWGWINNGGNYTSYGKGDTNTFITITGLVPGSSHEWGVRAYDAEGYYSGFDYGPTVVNPIPAPPVLTIAPSLDAQPLTGGGVSSPPVGSFDLTVSAGNSGLQTFLIQASTNPADPASWLQIGSVFPASNPFTFTDTDAAQYPMRLYRICAP